MKKEYVPAAANLGSSKGPLDFFERCVRRKTKTNFTWGANFPLGGGVAVNIILGFIEAHSSTAGDPGRNGEGQEGIKPSVPTIRSILMVDAIP